MLCGICSSSWGHRSSLTRGQRGMEMGCPLENHLTSSSHIRHHGEEICSALYRPAQPTHTQHILNEWMNVIWLLALPGQLHVGLKTSPLCPMIALLLWIAMLKEPCSFTTVPDGPYTWFSNNLRVKNEGAQICMSE